MTAGVEAHGALSTAIGICCSEKTSSSDNASFTLNV